MASTAEINDIMIYTKDEGYIRDLLEIQCDRSIECASIIEVATK